MNIFEIECKVTMKNVPLKGRIKKGRHVTSLFCFTFHSFPECVWINKPIE
jgi:hypothetical protein